MVGTTTAKNDNPQLTARLWQGKQPLRVVIDQVLKLDNHGNLFDDAAATWVINEKREGLLGNIHYIQMAFDDSFLKNLLQKLFDAKILSIIIEGGPTLLGSFIAAGLWDEARVFTGSTQLGFGIAAPVLTGADFAFENNLGGDKLQLFINKNSSYKYPKGYKLEL